MAVLLDEGAAAAGRLHDGFGTGLDGRPPGVDIAPRTVQTGLLGVEVVVHRTATAGLTRRADADAQAVEHPCSGGVGVRRQARLHAAFEHQHAAAVHDLRARFGRADLARQVILQRGRHQRLERIAGTQQCLEQARSRDHRAQAAAHDALAQRALHLLLDEVAADVQQVVVLHPGRAGGLAVAAGQAAVQVQLGALGHLTALEHLLHQVDPPARAVQPSPSSW